MKRFAVVSLFIISLASSLFSNPILLSNTTPEDIRKLLGNWNSEARIGSSADSSTNLINPNPVINFVLSMNAEHEYFLNTYEQNNYQVERIIQVVDKSYILILASCDEDGIITEPTQKSVLLIKITQKNKAVISDLDDRVFNKSEFDYGFIRLMGPD